MSLPIHCHDCAIERDVAIPAPGTCPHQARTVTLHKRTDYTIEAPAYGEHMGISEIERLAGNMGSHYFEPATMQFFRSRVDWHVWPGADGWYFVTSEQHKGFDGTMRPRLYSVRRFSYERNPNGTFGGVDFDTIGEFQEYPTLGRARTAARKAAADSERPAGNPDAVLRSGMDEPSDDDPTGATR